MTIEPDRLVSAREDSSEAGLDRALRPERLTDYVGQGPVKEQMSIFIEAARQRGEALDHTLIFGPPGLGRDGADRAQLVGAGRQLEPGR